MPPAVPPRLDGGGGGGGGEGGQTGLQLPLCVGMHHWNHLIHTVNVTGLMSGKESPGTKGGLCVCCVCCVCLGRGGWGGGCYICMCVYGRNGGDIKSQGQAAAPCSCN